MGRLDRAGWPVKYLRQFPGATPYRDRHGVRRWRYRAKGFSAQLGTEYGSEEFVIRYEGAQRGERARAGAGSKRTAPGSLGELCVSYLQSPTYLRLGKSSRSREANEIKRLRAAYGSNPVAPIERRHIIAMMGVRHATPASANHLLRQWRKLLKHAMDIGMRQDNPAREVEFYTTSPDGLHTWSEGEIRKFFAKHEPGTTAHVAVSLMLHTGAARVDAVRLGWANIRGSRLVYRRRKTETKTDIVVDIPIHPELGAVLATLPRDRATFLGVASGKERSSNGLGNAMRKWCDRAALPECTAHGLRKAIARRLAEAGASPHEIMAVTGHSTLKEVERYSRAAGRAGLADRAAERLTEAAAKITNLADRAKARGAE
jgi:integrase